MDENNINNNNTDNNLPNNEEVLNNNLASNDSTLNDNVTNNENTANTNTTTNMQSNELNNGEEIKKEASAQEIVKKETVNVVQNNQPINNSKQNTNNMENDKKQVNDKKGFSIAALVLGIVAIVLSCIWYISIPCAILAIVFGILGIKSSKKGMSIAGITTGAIGMFICIAILIVLMIFGFAMGITDSITEIIEDEDYYDYYDSSYYFDYKDF